MKRIAILTIGAATGALAAAAGEVTDFAKIDADNDGTVTMQEFSDWKTSETDMREGEAVNHFNMLDADSDAVLTKAEYQEAKEDWAKRPYDEGYGLGTGKDLGDED